MGGRHYEPVYGFFLQDDVSAVGIPAVPPSFGLIEKSADRWTILFDQVKRLNDSADHHTSYKVFLFGRHGQGYHNIAEAKYGTKPWDDYWSKLDGDGDLVWGPDPGLTTLGEEQAVVAAKEWKIQLASGMPLPGGLYCSPLTRAIATCKITFADILPYDCRPFILENCREENGVHTCDKRRTKSYIETTFPIFAVEPGFTEEDELWDPNAREPKARIAERARQVLDYVFERDRNTFISVTGHGGIINGFLTVLGRPIYPLPTGGWYQTFQLSPHRASSDFCSTGVLPVVIKSVYTQ